MSSLLFGNTGVGVADNYIRATALQKMCFLMQRLNSLPQVAFIKRFKILRGQTLQGAIYSVLLKVQHLPEQPCLRKCLTWVQHTF